MDDGIQISLLLLGFLARFYKELILQGKVYFVKTPLFVGRKGETIKFAFTEEERDQKLVGMDISRIKGLGELNDEELSPFVWNDKVRQLEQVKVPEENYDEFLETLAIALSQTEDNKQIRREIF